MRSFIFFNIVILFIFLTCDITLLAQTNTWLGSTDTDWHKACNWSTGVIPVCADDVIIPVATNQPIVSGIAHCNKIEIQTVASTLFSIISTGILEVGLGGTCVGIPTDNGGCCTTQQWLQTSNPSSNSEIAYDLALNSTDMYIIGSDASLGLGKQLWRIERRLQSTGALIAAFGTSGVIQSDPNTLQPDDPSCISIDGTGIYIGGYRANSLTNTEWRVEKRNLTTGALVGAFATGGVYTYNPTTANEQVYDLAVDGTRLYVVGFETVGDLQWHMKSLNSTTGAVNWSVTSDPSGGADYAESVAFDASGVYISGRDNSPGNDQWRIEKRSTATGTLIAGFGAGGVVTINPSAAKDYISGIAVDATGLYIVGYVDPIGSFDYEWRIEKRDLTTGALVAAFGTSGIVTINPSTGYDAALDVEVDASGVYIIGYDIFSGTRQWRMEKLNKTTGSIVCTQSSLGRNEAYKIALNSSSEAFAVGSNTSTPIFSGNIQWRMQKQCQCP